MKDTSRLFRWISEASRLNRPITYRLPIRNTASVHLDSNNPGACRPDHVYFRPPPSLASVHEDPGALRSPQRRAILPLRGSRCKWACGEENGEIQGKKGEGGRHLSALPLSAPPLPCSHCRRLRGAERLWRHMSLFRALLGLREWRGGARGRSHPPGEERGGELRRCQRCLCQRERSAWFLSGFLSCTFLSMGLFCSCLGPLSEVDLRCEKTVSTSCY